MTVNGGKMAIIWLTLTVSAIAIYDSTSWPLRENGGIYFDLGLFFGMLAVPYVNAFVGLRSTKKSVVAGCRFLAFFYVVLFLPGLFPGSHNKSNDGPNLAFFLLPWFIAFLSSFAYLLYYIVKYGLSGDRNRDD